LAQTLRLLDQNAIAHFGAGLDLAQAHEPLIVERKGLRVALLGYNEFHPRSFEADFDKAGVAWSEDEQVKSDIAQARSRWRADLVITFMHWGWEDETAPSARQRELARLMIDAGADAVVGGHPHVIQGLEHYAGKPIFYSLGNFVFDGFDDESNNTGWLLQLKLDRQGVRAWRTHTARIDKQGLPHPVRTKNDWCWERGQTTPGFCAPQTP
jgi:poly-gamma-glutamate synthesis protein (capsule biosynthesis protein)